MAHYCQTSIPQEIRRGDEERGRGVQHNPLDTFNNRLELSKRWPKKIITNAFQIPLVLLFLDQCNWGYYAKICFPDTNIYFGTDRLEVCFQTEVFLPILFQVEAFSFKDYFVLV